MQWFRIPNDIVFGCGSVSYLKNIKGNKAFVVTGGSSMKKHGFLDKAIGFLQEAGMEVRLFDGVEPDPSVATVYRGAAAMRDFEPDWIVSIGGGSAIDAAKAMWIFYEHPDQTFADVIQPFGIPTLRNKARFVAIPSTSGTATEVTCASVITDYDTPNKLKYPLLSYEIMPDIAILDGELTLSMPSHITAHTGMDALTHAVEAYVSTNHNPFTDPLALEAIRLVFEYLPQAYEDGTCQEARDKMHYAQCMAGMAFTNAFLGIVHSMAHKIGAQFGIPHGEANSILLPYVIEYNGETAPERYIQIAKGLGLSIQEGECGVKALANAVRALNAKLGIPQTLMEAGIDKAAFYAALDETSQNALNDPCTGCNPRQPITEDIKNIYLAAFSGSK